MNRLKQLAKELVPVVHASDVDWVTVEQMAEADGIAVHEFGITLLQMMEHAGRSLADLTDALLPEGRVTILAGGGNNGAGGLCAARHLANIGRDVSIVLATNPNEAAQHHLKTLSAMGIEDGAQPGGEVLIDALVGYGLGGPLRGRALRLAEWTRDGPTVSLDVPSGLGFAGAVDPVATLTLALPKTHLSTVSPLYLADLGLPAALWERLGIECGNTFTRGRIVHIVE